MNSTSALAGAKGASGLSKLAFTGAVGSSLPAKGLSAPVYSIELLSLSGVVVGIHGDSACVNSIFTGTWAKGISGLALLDVSASKL